MKAAKVVKRAIATESTSDFGPSVPVTPINDVVIARPQFRDMSGHLQMQGHAPVVKISKNRRYCEYCGEAVRAGVLHVCWGNVEHHMHTLTAPDRERIMAQLASKPKKLTRKQLKKLYADGGPAAEY